MKKPLRVLIVEDAASDAALLTRQLQQGGYDPSARRVESAEELVVALSEGAWDLVLCDYRLPGFGALAALKLVQERGGDVPFILVSGVIGEEQAVAAMKAGAHDFVLKDKLVRLVPAVDRELREAEMRRHRREAEEALRQAKVEWERTFDSVPDLIAILDDQFRIQRVNQTMARRLGMTAEQCVGQACFKVVHGAECTPAACPHRLTLADGRTHEAEVHDDRLGGVFLVTTTPLTDEQGRRLGSVHVARDITARKRAEQELRHHQERLLLAQQAGRVGVFDVDFLTGASVWTDQRKALFGVPATFQETVHAWSPFVHPDDLEPVRAEFQRTIQARRAELEQCYRIRRPDGQVRWLEDRALITYDEGGKPLRMVGTTIDITADKLALERLRRSEKKFQQSAVRLVLILAFSIFVAESAAMILLALLPKLWAWQSILLDATTMLLLASPMLYYSAFRPLVRLLKEREQAQEELRRANEHLEARVRERTVRLEEANQALQAEIAERRRAQDALRQAHDELEEKVRERTGELVAANAALQNEMSERRSLEARIFSISESEQRRIGQDLHDGLSQQLAGIAYLCCALQKRLARKDAEEAAALDQITQLIQEANTQAHGLARGLSPVSLEAGGLMTALRGLVANLQSVYPITVHFECLDPVPVRDNAVATHLYRIAQEALGNAAKHSKATRVTLRLTADPRSVTLTVKDNGQGLPAQPRSTSGMGLETMRYRARSIGASLDIHNDPQNGVVLTCTVPIPTELPAPAIP